MDLETLLKYSGVNNSEVTQKELNDTEKSQTNEGDNIYHDCAKSFKHHKLGECECIPGQHTLLEDGTVTHYDVKVVRNGKTVIVKNVPIAEATDIVSEYHMHKAKKKKSKKMKEAVGQFADPIYDLIDDMGADPDHPVLNELIRYLDGDTIRDFVSDFRRMNDMPNQMDEEEVEEDNAFNTAAAKAAVAGEKDFTFNGKKYPVKMSKEDAKKLLDDVNEETETEDVQTESMSSDAKMFATDAMELAQEKLNFMKSIGKFSYTDSDQMEFTDELEDDELRMHPMVQQVLKAIPQVDGEEEEIMQALKNIADGEFVDFEDVRGTMESVDSETVEEDFLGDMMTLAGLHKPVEEEQTNESYFKDMMQDVEEGMTKEEFAKKYPASADEYDKIKAELEESNVQEDAVDEVVESQDNETVEITKEDLANLLDLAGITPTQATDNELDEYANSPDEDYKDSDYMVNKLAGGLNGPKTQTDKGYPGDNPLAAKLAGRLQAMLDDINKQ